MAKRRRGLTRKHLSKIWALEGCLAPERGETGTGGLIGDLMPVVDMSGEKRMAEFLKCSQVIEFKVPRDLDFQRVGDISGAQQCGSPREEHLGKTPLRCPALLLPILASYPIAQRPLLCISNPPILCVPQHPLQSAPPSPWHRGGHRYPR